MTLTGPFRDVLDQALGPDEPARTDLPLPKIRLADSASCTCWSLLVQW